MSYHIQVLFGGYSHNTENGSLRANCTCTLIRTPTKCIIVDTMTAWDGDRLREALHSQNLQPEKIDYVVCTHGHSDHIGCNYLFPNALHIVGHSISRQDEYFDHDFKGGADYIIDDKIRIMPTPGHTLQDVTVLVNVHGVIYAVTGDLFEREEDLEDESIWIEAGSDSVKLQRESRLKILESADVIIPGHGPLFKTIKYKEK